jgi:hypothetical protein
VTEVESSSSSSGASSPSTDDVALLSSSSSSSGGADGGLTNTSSSYYSSSSSSSSTGDFNLTGLNMSSGAVSKTTGVGGNGGVVTSAILLAIATLFTAGFGLQGV